MEFYGHDDGLPIWAIRL